MLDGVVVCGVDVAVVEDAAKNAVAEKVTVAEDRTEVVADVVGVIAVPVWAMDFTTFDANGVTVVDMVVDADVIAVVVAAMWRRGRGCRRGCCHGRGRGC